MLPRKVIIRFAVFVVFFYSLLMIPWPGLERGYAGIFRAGGDALFSRFWFWPSGNVRFLDLHSERLFEELDAATPGQLPKGVKLPEAEGVKDTLMVLMNSAKPDNFGLLRTGSRYLAYEPLAAVLALSLATPIGWRRIWVVVWGLFWVHIFIAVRVSLILAGEFFNPAKKYALALASPFWLKSLGQAEEVFSDNPTATLVVAMFIWLVAVVGLFGWSAWRSSSETSRPNAQGR